MNRMVLAQTGPTFAPKDVLIQAEWSDAQGPRSQRITELVTPDVFIQCVNALRQVGSYVDATLKPSVDTTSEIARARDTIAQLQARVQALGG